MQPKARRENLRTFQRPRLVLVKFNDLWGLKFWKLKLNGLSWFFRTWTNPGYVFDTIQLNSMILKWGNYYYNLLCLFEHCFWLVCGVMHSAHELCSLQSIFQFKLYEPHIYKHNVSCWSLQGFFYHIFKFLTISFSFE